MRYYRKEEIEQVRKSVRIEELIAEATVVRREDGLLIAVCPFHKTDEKEPETLLISEAEQVFQCMDCGESGDVFSFWMKQMGVSFHEAVEQLAMRNGITLSKPVESTFGRQERNLLYAINREAALFYHKSLTEQTDNPGMVYLTEKRKITDASVIRFGLGYAPDRSDALYWHLRKLGYRREEMETTGLVGFYRGNPYDKFQNRMMCPILDMERHVVGFSGRFVGENTGWKEEPKYKNSPQTLVFDKKALLFGLNLAQHTDKDSFLICEGNLDVISLHQHGFDNAVASLGTSFTKEQAALIRQYTNQVHLVFDSDEAGKKAALRTIPILRKEGLSVDVVHLEPYKDPDEFLQAEGAGAFENRLAQAEDSYAFEVRTRYASLDTGTMMQEFGQMILACSEKEQDRYILEMKTYLKQKEYLEEMTKLAMPAELLIEETKKKEMTALPIEEFLSEYEIVIATEDVQL